MKEMVKKFPETIAEGLAVGAKAEIKKPKTAIKNVFVSGLGGSGIGANYVQDLVRSEMKVPMVVSKGYVIPAWIGPSTLAIFSSYSGNTEETISAFEKALPTGAKIVVVASGGRLIELAKQHGLDFVEAPSGWASPRATLAFSVCIQLSILKKLRLIRPDVLKNMKNGIKFIKKEQRDIEKRARQLAQFLADKLPIIYTTDRMESVAVRLRQQINENSKMLCWHHIVPEMNHNELVGWRTEDARFAVIYLRNHDDLERNQARIDLNKEIIGHFTGSVIEVFSNGSNFVEQMLYFTHLGDWLSVILADLRKVDATEIRVIDFLKTELSKL